VALTGAFLPLAYGAAAASASAYSSAAAASA